MNHTSFMTNLKNMYKNSSYEDRLEMIQLPAPDVLRQRLFPPVLHSMIIPLVIIFCDNLLRKEVILILSKISAIPSAMSLKIHTYSVLGLTRQAKKNVRQAVLTTIITTYSFSTVVRVVPENGYSLAIIRTWQTSCTRYQKTYGLYTDPQWVFER